MHEEDTKGSHGPSNPHGPRHPHGHHGKKGMMGCFPFSPEQMHKMKHMAKHFMRDFMGGPGGHGRHIPYNIDDLGESYLITLPLAGRSKEDVKVSLINNHLNIKAEKPKIPELEKEKENPEEKTGNECCCSPNFLKGFTFIEVNMDIPLPVDVDADTLVSKMANGLLKITMGKKPAKNINISDN